MKLFRLSSLQHIIPLSKDDLKVVATVLFYMCSSISMVMLNKIVLNVTEAPIFFLWMQLIVAVGPLNLAALSGLLTLPTLKWSKCRDVMPLIMVNTIGLSANTICLQYVDASLFQV